MMVHIAGVVNKELDECRVADKLQRIPSAKVTVARAHTAAECKALPMVFILAGDGDLGQCLGMHHCRCWSTRRVIDAKGCRRELPSHVIDCGMLPSAKVTVARPVQRPNAPLLISDSRELLLTPERYQRSTIADRLQHDTLCKVTVDRRAQNHKCTAADVGHGRRNCD
jgi:hypothetical protein